MLLRTQQCNLSLGSCLQNSSSTPHLCFTVFRRHGTHLSTSNHAASTSATWFSNTLAASKAAGPDSSSLATSAGVICRDAPRPMWAAKTPPEDGDAIARLITRELTKCDSLTALSDVYNDWGGSFNYINAAAAIYKYAKLSRSRGSDTQLLPKLLRCWLQLLPDATIQACANVLWALGKLGTALDEVWVPTFETYLNLLEQNPQSRSGSAQDLANVLWACAKLRKQPAPGQLAVLMQAVLLPEVLAAAQAQELSNMVWALSKLAQLQGWQGGVSEADIQQLLGEQQLQLLSATGTPRNISNVLLGLTDMTMADPPVSSKAFAQQCSRQLLAVCTQRLVGGNPQNIGNALYACGELGLADDPFLAATAAAAASWVPISQSRNVIQAAIACAKLQFRHQGLMAALLQRGQQLLLQATKTGGRQQQSVPSDAGQNDRLLGILCSAVAHLDMQQLAPQAMQLVKTSGIGQRPNTHPADLRRLWVFHSWLLQHQLLGGQGLTGLLTQQQLQQGKDEAALFQEGF